MGTRGGLDVVHGRTAAPMGDVGHTPAAIAFRAAHATHTGSMMPSKQQQRLGKLQI